MANSRPIAMGIARIAYGTVGDGVPASAFTDLPLPTKSSVAFNFQDPKKCVSMSKALLILSM